MASFIDHIDISVKAGDGGDGAISFHREKFITKGGPDGGDGGKGGDVYFYADTGIHTLLDFRYVRKYAAENGDNGSSKKRKGKQGKDLIIRVPVGTLIKDRDSGKLFADMFTPGEKKLLFRGGNGGFGNAQFATPTRQAPNFAKPGKKSKSHRLTLELKTIADVGLIGYPNVGKSTILSVLTAAKPKIANYHFTTLSPNLGIVRHHEYDFVLADIPGLIEGASSGIGLGHDFLRHVERTRLLLHVVDISGHENRDPIEDYVKINKELASYKNLDKKPQILVLNKIDIDPESKNIERMLSFVNESNIPSYLVSAATNQGFEPLLNEIIKKLSLLPPIEIFEEDYFETVDNESSFTVSNELEGEFIVSGPYIEYLLRSVNFDDNESINWFHRTLRRNGIIDALKDKGAKEGSIVQMGNLTFDFIE